MAVFYLAERLQQAIWKSDLSTKEVARRAGISRSLLNAYISGDSTPGAENLLRLCDVLRVSSDWLLGLKNE